jgi:HlyD family secretion protein
VNDLRAMLRRRPGATAAGATLAVGILAALLLTSRGRSLMAGSPPDLPTSEVVRGEFVDALEIRGDIRPLKSVVVAAPMRSGELQIVTLARNGSQVQAGDLLVEFDASTLRRTLQEKQSELKQAEAEIEQAEAEARITREQNQTALMRAQYDIERARLDVQKGDTVSRIETEQARLALGDAEQRLQELKAKVAADQTGAEADLATRRRKRDKALFDLQQAERGIRNLELRAPSAGIVSILPNFRAGGPFGANPEFRTGDRAWPGAAIVELPDLSSVHLEARVDEADRGRLSVGQEASIRIEAIPGREFVATIDQISVLAKVDYGAGWPPVRNFELDLVLKEIDPKIRPGMSAVARIATDRVAGVVLVPASAIFQRDGHPVVYRLDGTEFVEQRVDIRRRGAESAIVDGGIDVGVRVATRRPPVESIRRAP